MARKRKRARRVRANVGASKALAALMRRYGARRGRVIFYSLGSKFGRRGLTPSQKTNSVFGKGSHRRQVRRAR